jgi:sec-independent protein translocase protein TatA
MLAFGIVGNWEVLLALLVALLLFGSRLPSVMRSLGKSVSSFKKGLREVEDEIDTAGDGEGPPTSDGDSPPPAG